MGVRAIKGEWPLGGCVPPGLPLPAARHSRPQPGESEYIVFFIHVGLGDPPVAKKLNLR